MNKKIILFDILFFLALPYIIWNYGRDFLSDYYAMLFSTVPGFLYSIFRFIKERQFNITGLWIISSLLISTSVDLLSGSALNMLWNQVYLGYSFTAIILLSMMIRKPLCLYFTVDFAALQGYPRENSLALYFAKGNFTLFQWLTGLFVIRGVFQNSLKAWLIHTYGVNGYDEMLIYIRISGWVFTALIAAGFFYIGIRINQYLKENEFDFPIK